MKSAIRIPLVALLAAGLPLAAHAHKAFLVPSQTVLSEKSGWITVDGASSNDIFFYNHRPMNLEQLAITAPDGSVVKAQNAATGKFRSTFDVELTKPGTYRIAVAGDNVNAQFKVNGESKRWRGAAAQLAANIPAGATDVSVSHTARRIETFVTLGKPGALPGVTGAGLELIAVTHPNDLYAGEAAKFRFDLDGKPAANVEIEVVAAGTRYRDQQGEMKLKTDAQGNVQITWPAAGMYWLEAVAPEGKSPLPQATSRTATYVATFEVLTQ